MPFDHQGPRCCTATVWCKQSCRRRFGTCANGQLGFPRNLGEPCSLLGEFPAGDTGLPTPGPSGSLVRLGAKQRVQPRYRQAKETKCGGMAAGRRSALIVLMKQGNSPWRTLWRKAKRRPADLIEGNMPNTSRFDQHVHVTRLDSYGDHRGWRTCRSRNRMR